MVANEVSVIIKTKNTFKYDYFPSFLLYLENALFTDHLNIEKRLKIVKGYLHYKTISSQNVLYEAQVKNFFVS